MTAAFSIIKGNEIYDVENHMAAICNLSSVRVLSRIFHWKYCIRHVTFIFRKFWAWFFDGYGQSSIWLALSTRQGGIFDFSRHMNRHHNQKWLNDSLHGSDSARMHWFSKNIWCSQFTVDSSSKIVIWIFVNNSKRTEDIR